jgi:ribosomal protein S18 acetylase RimI-like enzyme
VRRIGPDDWELFRRVRLAALAQAPEVFGSRYEDWVDAEPARWQARLTGVPLNLVAIADGQPVGLVSGTAPADDSVELISLWIAPSARGRGLADDLVRRVLAWARAQGIGWVLLSVKIANAPARALYRRSGFVEAGPSTEDPTELIMGRPAADSGPAEWGQRSRSSRV